MVVEPIINRKTYRVNASADEYLSACTVFLNTSLHRIQSTIHLVRLCTTIYIMYNNNNGC